VPILNVSYEKLKKKTIDAYRKYSEISPWAYTGPKTPFAGSIWFQVLPSKKTKAIQWYTIIFLFISKDIVE
jgi:hypothetical protein